MKVFSSIDPLEEVLKQLKSIGVAPFGETTTLFENYYEKIKPLLNDSIHKSCCLNHPKEGYFYFLYDIDMLTREEANNKVLQMENYD